MYLYTLEVYRYTLRKKWQKPKCTGTLSRFLGKMRLKPPNFMAFDIQTSLHSLQSQTLAFLSSHTSNPVFVCFCQSFHRSGPNFFFCNHRTDVVSLLQILDSIFGPFIVIHGPVWLVLVSSFLYLLGWSFGRWAEEEISI